jgi:clan AA aspartic protease (TIGR02281 family)
MKIIKWLSIVLSISLGANLWFLWYFYDSSNQPFSPIQAMQHKALQDNTSQVAQDGNISENAVRQLKNNKQPSISWDEQAVVIDESELTKIKAQRSSFLAYLNNLAQKQQFVLLEYEVTDYLRLYPQDIEAVLLEAMAYYHTQPLNTALVHYIELLSLPLPIEDREEVEKLIMVNITRVIQQFSGDGAWDLLAEFLEPLVQVDPINRQYLMPLARAYGMQRQFSLMEDALAAFSPTDVRANRLRDNVMARLNNEPSAQTPDDLPLLAELPQNRNREADVLVKQNRGRFVTQARVHNTPVNLLVDTGASTTALSDIKFSTIDKKHLEFLGLFNVNTAGGTIEAPIYKVSQFKIGQRTLRNTSVLVLPAENLSQYDGLLGMNVLSQFDLAYDAETETMRMYRKR